MKFEDIDKGIRKHVCCLDWSKIERTEQKFSKRQKFQCRGENWRIYNSTRRFKML